MKSLTRNKWIKKNKKNEKKERKKENALVGIGQFYSCGGKKNEKKEKMKNKWYTVIHFNVIKLFNI